MRTEYVMHEGVVTEVEVKDGEEFDVNDHIQVTGAAPTAQTKEFDKSQFVEDQLTDDNTFKGGSKGWYKHELDSFQGIKHDDSMTIAELHELLLKAHGVKE